MNDLGFKKLTLENLLEVDKYNNYFVRYSDDMQSKHIITLVERLNDIITPSLSDKVPLEIRRQFEVARGCMAYGYYFYPLYSLGFEKIFKVMETSVSLKLEKMSIKTKNMRFSNKINLLKTEGILTDSKREYWNNIRLLRNKLTHSENQNIITPFDVLRIINEATNEINFLFDKTV